MNESQNSSKSSLKVPESSNDDAVQVLSAYSESEYGDSRYFKQGNQIEIQDDGSDDADNQDEESCNQIVDDLSVNTDLVKGAIIKSRIQELVE